MNINATLIIQGITFFVFIVFTMKVVWPHILRAMQERQQRIADGLAAAERGMRDLAEAKEQVALMLKQARDQSAEVLAQANRRATEIIEEAKVAARLEGERLIAAARAQVQQEISQAREQLRREVAALAVASATRILQREIDAKAHADLLEQAARQLN